MSHSLIALCLGFGLDWLFGDPHWMPHPIRLIGWLIQKMERLLWSYEAEGVYMRARGACCTWTVIFFSTATPLFLLSVSGWVSPWLRLAVETLMCYQILAGRALWDESMQVYKHLRAGDQKGARTAISRIVGRDTQNLSEEQITKAAVETVAENASDGVVAPLFYMVLGGAQLGFVYKAINTLDSMIGYKNEHYFDFGRCAAKLDDYANFIPARLTALLMILGAYVLGYDGKNAIRIFLRDRFNHSSPNSAQTESVCAGALGLRLAGDAYYFGELVEKAYIGDEQRRAVPQDIPASNRLMIFAASAALVLCVSLSVIFI